MKGPSLMVILTLLGVALAGCTGEPEFESVEPEGKRRGVVLYVPDEFERVQVELRMTSRGSPQDTPHVEVVVEHENGTDIQSQSFDLGTRNATRILDVEPPADQILAVLVVVSDGDATIDLIIRGNDGGNSTLLRYERFEFSDRGPAPRFPPANDTASDDAARENETASGNATNATAANGTNTSS